jgi:hypothetical protein
MLDLGFIGSWILVSDTLTGDVAGQFVQIQSNGQALLTGHAAVTFDLFL